MELSQVSVVIPTRGDVDLAPIMESLATCGEVVVWNNSERDDLAVYGRYAAIAEAKNDVVLTQDDDVILPLESLEALVAAYEPGVLTANMPARFRHDFYRDHCLVGFGAIFDRGLPGYSFGRFWGSPYVSRLDGETNRTCDVIFTALTPRKLVDVPYRDLPWADTPDRMWRQPGHLAERSRMLELARQVRDA